MRCFCYLHCWACRLPFIFPQVFFAATPICPMSLLLLWLFLHPACSLVPELCPLALSQRSIVDCRGFTGRRGVGHSSALRVWAFGCLKGVPHVLVGQFFSPAARAPRVLFRLLFVFLVFPLCAPFCALLVRVPICVVPFHFSHPLPCGLAPAAVPKSIAVGVLPYGKYTRRSASLVVVSLLPTAKRSYSAQCGYSRRGAI